MDKKKKNKLKKSRTEADAVHPRFLMKPEDEEEMKKYESEHHYFCSTCKIYIAPTNLSLKMHFKEEIKDHPPYGMCYYCKGDTFEYKFNGNIRYYHNCADYLAKK